MLKNNTERKFDIANTIIMLTVIFMCVYPLWYVLCLSLTDDNLVQVRNVWFLPKAFTVDSYKAVFGNNLLMTAFTVSLKRTIIGTMIAVFLNALMAYALSKKYLVWRKGLMLFVIVTMYFSGGLIPYYITLKTLHLTNSLWGLIVPAFYGGFNIIVMKAFFEGIPESLEESAKLDGASDITVFFRIILPLSAPIISTIALFIAVYHWNDWFMGDLLITKGNDIPLQTLLVRIIFQSQAVSLSMAAAAMKSQPSSESIKMAAIIVSTVPIMCVYPFLQKYFVKGIMLGAVKG